MLPSLTLFSEMANNFGQNSRESRPCLHLFDIIFLKNISVYLNDAKVLLFYVKCNQMLKLCHYEHVFDLMILYSAFKMWGGHRALHCAATTHAF